MPPTKTRLALILLAVVALVGACNREPVSPSDYSAIEYRVQGTVPSATIRYGNPLDGLTQTVSSLPWSVRVYGSPAGFVSLDASSQFTGLLQVQILTNGTIFRDSTVTGSAPVAGVSGNFRPW